MFRRLMLLTITACVLTMPAAVQAPAATTTFDGKYLGVSAELSNGGTGPWHCFPRPLGSPTPLTITNGVVSGLWEGTVSPQGAVVLRRNSDLMRIDAQIDPQGTVRGFYSGAGGYNTCIVRLVWQKVPPPTMPFDGDYVGVSRESSCLPNRVPVTLIIRNSLVVAEGSWQGNVNPQGVVIMGNRLTPRVNGQIDKQGVLRAQGSSSDGGCTVTFVWRKQSG